MQAAQQASDMPGSHTMPQQSQQPSQQHPGAGSAFGHAGLPFAVTSTLGLPGVARTHPTPTSLAVATPNTPGRRSMDSGLVGSATNGTHQLLSGPPGAGLPNTTTVTGGFGSVGVGFGAGSRVLGNGVHAPAAVQTTTSSPPLSSSSQQPSVQMILDFLSQYQQPPPNGQ